MNNIQKVFDSSPHSYIVDLLLDLNNFCFF